MKINTINHINPNMSSLSKQLGMLNFLNAIIYSPYIFGTVHYHFRDIKILRIWKLVSQQHRAWSDCTDVKAGPDPYWWQRLITYGYQLLAG